MIEVLLFTMIGNKLGLGPWYWAFLVVLFISKSIDLFIYWFYSSDDEDED